MLVLQGLTNILKTLLDPELVARFQNCTFRLNWFLLDEISIYTRAFVIK